MIVLGVIAIIILFVLAAMFSGWLWWLVWNLVVEGMFHGPHLNYWVAVLLSLVIGGLFRGARASSN